ncbi:CGNR zinc finger domain-containing protein [Microbacterium sp. NPDC055910]|uniref:CGNR zinc finger domain-containing protein n=1 Tax=Microbacterium sp. NPDC055910 TaxID=3345659 RepID=UPI0035DA37E2
MVFIRDTRQSLEAAAALVNTLPLCDGEDTMTTVADLDSYLADHPYSGTVRRDRATVEEIRQVRARVRKLWEVDREGAVPLINDMLRDGEAVPRLVIHGEHDWHIHATPDDAPIATRIMVEAAMAFVEVIRSDSYDRVRVCEADDCDAVYIDYSRNGSKRYCDTGNCGNRMNVIAYRERKARESA